MTCPRAESEFRISNHRYGLRIWKQNTVPKLTPFYLPFSSKSFWLFNIIWHYFCAESGERLKRSAEKFFVAVSDNQSSWNLRFYFSLIFVTNDSQINVLRARVCWLLIQSLWWLSVEFSARFLQSSLTGSGSSQIFLSARLLGACDAPVEIRAFETLQRRKFFENPSNVEVLSGVTQQFNRLQSCLHISTVFCFYFYLVCKLPRYRNLKTSEIHLF